MRELIIAGNWKMNGSKQEITSLVTGIIAGLGVSRAGRVIICPPAPYLAQVEGLVAKQAIALGAQNVSYHNAGAFTGEMSVVMAKDFNVKYVIVGHSERRSLYDDTNQVVIKKIKALQASGITPIFCIGESLKQRESGQMEDVISTQVDVVIDAIGIDAFKNIIIAYEPIWAIGTGVTASPDQAQQAHHFIRNLLAKHSANIAENIAILYGGSVNGSNAAELFTCADIDGGLVGGASLKVDDFLTICQG